MGLRAFFSRWRRPAQVDNASHAWWVGDLAECVDDPQWIRATTGERTTGPAKRDVNRVVEVNYIDGDVCLRFKKWPGGCYVHTAFRKIVPQADRAQPADADFLPLLQRRPAREDA